MNKEFANKSLFEIIKNSDASDDIIKCAQKMCAAFATESYAEDIYEYEEIRKISTLGYRCGMSEVSAVLDKTIPLLADKNFAMFMRALVNYDLCWHKVLVKMVIEICDAFREHEKDRLVKKYMELCSHFESNSLIGLSDLVDPITELYDLSNYL